MYAPGPAGPVHWVEAGHGPPLVLLHGLGGDVGFWSAEIEAWSERFRVIAIDLRGSGATAASEGGHTMADLSDDVVAVLDDAAVDSANVVGFSMGGNVALTLALRNADRLRRLVLVSAFARMNPQVRLFLDAVLAGYERTRDSAQMLRLIYPWLFSIDFLADPANDDFRRAIEAAPDDQSLEDWRALYLAQQRFDVTAELDRIAVPTLLIAGEGDRLVSLDDAQVLVRGIAGSELQVLPRVGHLLNVEAPREFRTLVERFVSADLGAP